MKLLILLLTVVFAWNCSSSVQPKNKETRRLYLIRHAKSSHKDGNLEDIDRPLNDRGEKDAILIGKELSKKGVNCDKVLVSSSTRTRLTAKYLLKEIGFEENKIEYDRNIYRTSTENMISIINNVDPQDKDVAIIGHNPTTYQVANHFQKDTLFKDIPTCAVIAIEFEADSWEEIKAKKGKLLFFDYPKKYK
jgi:phosphohistidine phosphatase